MDISSSVDITSSVLLFCVFCWEGDSNSGDRTFWGLLSVDLELVGEMVEWPVVAVVEELVVVDRGEGVEIVVVEVVEVVTSTSTSW